MTDYARPAFARTAVVPGGTSAWDDCCAGQLSVWVEGVFPTVTFPAAVSRPNECFIPPSMAVVMIAEVVRCAPTLDTNGAAPTTVELEAASAVQLADSMALYRGALCYVSGIVGDGDGALVGPMTFPGPAGGCMAAQIRVTVEADASCICDAP